MERVIADDGSESAHLENGKSASVPTGEGDRPMTEFEEYRFEHHHGDDVFELPDPDPDAEVEETTSGFVWISLIGESDESDDADGDDQPVDDEERERDSSRFLDERDRWPYMLTLLEKAREAQFAGPYWNNLASGVGQYALGVMQGWIRSGRLWSEVAAIRWPVAPNYTERRQLEFDVQAREVLANEIVFSALERWRTLERAEQGWSPDGRAKLKTWFVTLCVRECPNGFRRWRKAHGWRDTELLEATEGAFGFDQRVGSPTFLPPERTAVALDELERVLEELELNNAELQVVELKACGYELAEISALTEMPVPEVRNFLRRLRYRGRGPSAHGK